MTVWHLFHKLKLKQPARVVAHFSLIKVDTSVTSYNKSCQKQLFVVGKVDQLWQERLLKDPQKQDC